MRHKKDRLPTLVAGSDAIFVFVNTQQLGPFPNLPRRYRDVSVLLSPLLSSLGLAFTRVTSPQTFLFSYGGHIAVDYCTD